MFYRGELFTIFLYLVAMVAVVFFLFINVWDGSFRLHYILGSIIGLAGFIFWLIARIQLGKAFSLSPKASFLAKEGLYSKFRHPIYYFSSVALFGVLIFSWNRYFLVAFFLIIALQIFRILKEDRILMQKFGQEYTNYKKNTLF